MYPKLSKEIIDQLKLDMELIYDTQSDFDHFRCNECDDYMTWCYSLTEIEEKINNCAYIYHHPIANDSLKDDMKYFYNKLRDIQTKISAKKEKTKLIKDRRKQFQKIKKSLFLELKNIKKQVCEICNTDQKISIDHIISISNGGSDDLSNLRFLCTSCNSRKGNRD